MAEVSDILKGVVEQNPLDIKTALGDLMMDKIKEVVADRKAELAAHFLNADGPEDFEEDEITDEGDETADEIEAEADEIGDEEPTDSEEPGDENADA